MLAEELNIEELITPTLRFLRSQADAKQALRTAGGGVRVTVWRCGPQCPAWGVRMPSAREGEKCVWGNILGMHYRREALEEAARYNLMVADKLSDAIYARAEKEAQE